MSYELRLTELSKKDLEKLDNSQRQQVLKSFIKIEQSGMQAGQKLHGNLSDFFGHEGTFRVY